MRRALSPDRVFFQAEDGIRDLTVTGVQTCALPISSRVGNLSPNWFDPKYWEARGELDGGARGRGTTHFVRSAGKEYVLRHYRRGGLIARVSGDRYVWQGQPSTRPFGEWQLAPPPHPARPPGP